MSPAPVSPNPGPSLSEPGLSGSAPDQGSVPDSATDQVHDAATWPLDQWQQRLTTLLCDASRRDDLHTYLARFANVAEHDAAPDLPQVADEVFDWLVAVHDTTDWTGSKTPTGFGEAVSVHMVTEGLKTLGRAISPARAARHVAERVETGVAFYPGMIEALARVEDPAVLTLAFDHRPSSHSRSDLGYPWRARCLRNPHLPSDAANRVLVEAAVQPGSGRRGLSDVVAEGLIDYAHAAAPLADPQVTARLVLADPERWWHEVAKAGVTRSVPGGVGFHDRTRDIHVALAAMLAETVEKMQTQYAPGEVVEVDGAELASAHPLRERLWWLLKYAEGPGFGTVVETLLTHPDKTVHRKAAAHHQLPLHLVPDLLTHSDVWMRRGAEQVLSRSLSEA